MKFYIDTMSSTVHFKRKYGKILGNYKLKYIKNSWDERKEGYIELSSLEELHQLIEELGERVIVDNLKDDSRTQENDELDKDAKCKIRIYDAWG